MNYASIDLVSKTFVESQVIHKHNQLKPRSMHKQTAVNLIFGSRLTTSNQFFHCRLSMNLIIPSENITKYIFHKDSMSSSIYDTLLSGLRLTHSYIFKILQAWLGLILTRDWFCYNFLPSKEWYLQKMSHVIL